MKKIKKYYSWNKFVNACKKAKKNPDDNIAHQMIFFGPDAEKISKEVDNELS